MSESIPKTPLYRDILSSLRQSFPQPVSDRVHDAYFVFSILRALDQVDAMKSASPLLGSPEELDYDSARRSRMADEPRSLESVTEQIVRYLSGMFIWGHPRAQINVVPAPTIPSIIAGTLPFIYNPNLVSDESSRRVAVAEVEASSMAAALVGYDPEQSGGVFTFGGTGTLLYGVKVGLEKASPGTVHSGLREPAVILCSERAHYACLTVANWLGLGDDNVIQVPTTEENELRPCLLESHARACAQRGEKDRRHRCHDGDDRRVRPGRPRRDCRDPRPARGRFFARVSSAHSCRRGHRLGLERVQRLRFPRESPQLSPSHGAGAGGDKSPHRQPRPGRFDRHRLPQDRIYALRFEPLPAAAIRPTSSGSPAATTRCRISSSPAHYHPGKYTLETTRGGSAPLAAMANMLLFGKDGLRSLLGHLVTMAEILRDHLNGHPATTVLNRASFGPVTLFRVYPDGVDTFSVPKREETDPAYRDVLRKHNDYNRRIFELVQTDALAGQGVVISMTDCYRLTDYGEPIVALKSYIMTPFSDEQYVQAVLESLWKAREIAAQG